MTPSSMRADSESWLLAIGRHLDGLERRFGAEGYKTVYMGGGTPSWLPRDILERALQRIGKSSSMATPLEWTIEANPEDVDETFLSILEASGVGRLSLGVQSLQDEVRHIAGRRGEAALIMERLELIAARWKGLWSCDLMYGLPAQSPGGLAFDATFLADLGLGHISLYELTLEPSTALYASVKDGSIILPDEDESADAYDAATEVLYNAGFNRYEVSNWALPGQNCLHNEVYWQMGDWLAIGPSGVGNVRMEDASFLRMENAPDTQAYGADPVASCVESIVRGHDAAFECLLTSLRTTRGCDLDVFKKRFLIDPLAVYGPLHQEFPELLTLEGSSWKASPRGLDTLNIPLVSALRHADEYYSIISEDHGEKKP